jgi:phosphatidylinositol glycan class Q protein
MDMTSPNFVGLFKITGMCGFLGLTIILSMISDLITFSTVHITILYSVSTRVYFWQFNILSSTFNIFRGKKYNPLRNRIDAAEYDLDQTLLGTIIFTLFVFLIPTVAAYHILFSIVKLV